MATISQKSAGRTPQHAPFSRGRTGCVLAVTLLSAVPVGAADPTPPELPAGKWLVDRARDYGLSSEGSPSVGDARMMLVWAKAAARISPDLAEAWFGQYILLDLLGRPDEARQALGNYSDLVPDDDLHRLIVLGERFEQLQTAEQRIELCTSQLAGPGLPGPVASELNRWLAETCRGTGEVNRARKHARRAVDLHRFNFTAWELLFELQAGQPSLADSTQRRLAAIAANPLLREECWGLARLLESLSLHDRAEEWYGRAWDGLRPPAGEEAVVVALLLDRARNLGEAGRFDSALDLADTAADLASDPYAARLLLIEVGRQAGRNQVVAQNLAALREQLAGSQAEVRRLGDARGAARIAWFHIDCDPDAAQALEFAEIALSAAPDDAQARRLHGLALLGAGQPEEAKRQLAPLTGGEQADQLAAWGLAQALLRLGDKEAALTVLRDAEQTCRSGPTYRRIIDSLGQLGAAALPMPDRSKVLAVLDAFDGNVLDFPEHPGNYLKLSATLVNPTPRFAERWRCRFALANRGTFPITIGPGQMVAADLLISAAVDVPQVDPLEGYLPVSLARRHVLEPGQRVEIEQTLDIGPLAEIAEMMPQRELEVTFSIVLDPEQTPQGLFASKLGDDLVVRTRLRRRKVAYTRDEIGALEHAARQGTPTERSQAQRTVAALMAERLAAMRGRLDYRPARIDKKGLETVLGRGLADPDPMVRACALDSLAMLPLGNERLQRAAPLLSDRHWLVRLMTADTLAVCQGTVFRPVAEHLAERDADPLVRELAGLHLQRWQAQEHKP